MSTRATPNQYEIVKATVTTKLGEISGFAVARRAHAGLVWTAIPSAWPSATQSLAVVYGGTRPNGRASKVKQDQARTHEPTFGVVVFVADPDPETQDTTLGAAEDVVIRKLNDVALDRDLFPTPVTMDWLTAEPFAIRGDDETRTYVGKDIRCHAQVRE